MVETTIRHRVLLEPRGFIRIISFILAIVTFATTGGYSGSAVGTIKCSGTATKTSRFTVPVSYPFNLEKTSVQVRVCNMTDSNQFVNTTIYLQGDFSPTSQWFVFVGVIAFLICLASIVFYVAFETGFRQTNEAAVTISDLVVTVLWTFLWLTAAASWAWGVGQVKMYASPGAVFNNPAVSPSCTPQGAVCNPQSEADFGSLNASVAFAFLSFLVWAGNVWFVYKETPYHDDHNPQAQPPSTSQ